MTSSKELYGGAGSLALTILCPNSLLTGNLTGNLANSGALKPHFLSLSCTFQKETSGSGKVRAGNLQECISE